MPDIKLRTLLPLLALATTLVACADGAGTTTPPVTPPLVGGAWFMHIANDTALPARISERFIGAVYEEIFLDSARIVIDDVAGTWEQRYWTRVNLQQVEDRRDFIIDEGTFVLTGATYTLTSTVRNREFSIVVWTPFQFETQERMALHTGAPIVEGLYRNSPP
jgi:hypothetical protein